VNSSGRPLRAHRGESPPIRRGAPAKASCPRSTSPPPSAFPRPHSRSVHSSGRPLASRSLHQLPATRFLARSIQKKLIKESKKMIDPAVRRSIQRPPAFSFVPFTSRSLQRPPAVDFRAPPAVDDFESRSSTKHAKQTPDCPLTPFDHQSAPAAHHSSYRALNAGNKRRRSEQSIKESRRGQKAFTKEEIEKTVERNVHDLAVSEPYSVRVRLSFFPPCRSSAQTHTNQQQNRAHDSLRSLFTLG
jgi:hypothetical protein